MVAAWVPLDSQMKIIYTRPSVLICLKQHNGWATLKLKRSWCLPSDAPKLVLTKIWIPSRDPRLHGGLGAALPQLLPGCTLSLPLPSPQAPSSCFAVMEILNLSSSCGSLVWKNLKSCPCLPVQPLAAGNFIYQLEPAGGRGPQHLTHRCVNSGVIWEHN